MGACHSKDKRWVRSPKDLQLECWNVRYAPILKTLDEAVIKSSPLILDTVKQLYDNKMAFAVSDRHLVSNTIDLSTDHYNYVYIAISDADILDLLQRARVQIGYH